MLFLSRVKFFRAVSSIWNSRVTGGRMERKAALILMKISHFDRTLQYKKDVLISFFRFEELRDLFLREYASATQDSFPESQIDFRSSVLPRPWLMPFMCGS